MDNDCGENGRRLRITDTLAAGKEGVWCLLTLNRIISRLIVILDLSEHEDEICHDAGVVIVGAGIAGLTLATRLRKSGVKVCVVESGGYREADLACPLKEVVLTGHPYRGASEGRSLCLGGTSTRWGGALLPFLDHDFDARPYIGQSAFPIGMADLRPYIPEVEAIFGLSSGSYEEDFVREIKAGPHLPLGDKDFWLRFAKWPRFSARNVAALFRTELRSDQGLKVWLNATVTRFIVAKESGRLRSIEARALSGKRLIITAERFVLCAGALESTRLLLLLDRQNGERISRRCMCLGRYFYDHISGLVANIEANDVKALNKLAGFRFVGSTMRSLRYELSPAAQRREAVGSAFAHINFRTEHPTAFDALRALLRSSQRDGNVDYESALSIARNLPEMFHTARWRYVNKQLLWPRPAEYELHLVVEQLPKAINRIFLSNETNALGVPMAGIYWSISPDERRTFEVFANLFDQYWERSGLRRIGPLKWRDAQSGEHNKDQGTSDVYHPGGTTRMGIDGVNAVVDETLKTFAVPNLWVASTSVLPTGGGANPTMTLLLLTLRLADHLTRH
jgi:choline dehydrogenase-like flavoprotein